MNPQPLPAYALAYAGQTHTRADGSVWRSSVTDCGRHFAVIWRLIALPDGTVLK